MVNQADTGMMQLDPPSNSDGIWNWQQNMSDRYV